MRTINKILFPYFIMICCCGCTDSAKKYLNSYINDHPEYKAIQFMPDTTVQLYHSIYPKNQFSGLRFDVRRYTVINFINTDCGSCFEAMSRWSEFLNNRDFGARVIFIASGSPSAYFENFFKENPKFVFDVYLDRSEHYLFDNKLIKFKKETFLVDRSGSVILYGDPTTNETIADYYGQVLYAKN